MYRNFNKYGLRIPTIQDVFKPVYVQQTHDPSNGGYVGEYQISITPDISGFVGGGCLTLPHCDGHHPQIPLEGFVVCQKCLLENEMLEWSRKNTIRNKIIFGVIFQPILPSFMQLTGDEQPKVAKPKQPESMQHYFVG